MNLQKLLPLRARREVNPRQRLDRPDGRVDQDGGVGLWVGAVERWRPRTPNGHRLALAAHADEEVEGAGRVDEVVATVGACMRKREMWIWTTVTVRLRKLHSYHSQ